jgi:LDH2 family malate/lactate/ureidoglycolate dehydrogenase
MTDLLDEIERTARAWESWDAKPGLASTAGAFEDAAQALARSAGIGASGLRATMSDLACNVPHGIHAERVGVIRQATEELISLG